MNRISALLSVVAAACLLLAVACGGSDSGSRGDEPTPARAARAEATNSPVKVTPKPTPEPTPAPAAGWTRYTTDDFEIDLPDSWQTWDPTKDSLEAIVQALQTDDPQLAKVFEDLGTNPGSPEWTFAAIDTESPTEFATNFGVLELRSPLPTTVRAAISQMEEQVPGLGGTLLSTESDLEIGGADAGRIEYQVTVGTVLGRELDYVVLPRPTRGFQLFFGAGVDEYTSLKPVFEQIAESFRAQ